MHRYLAATGIVVVVLGTAFAVGAAVGDVGSGGRAVPGRPVVRVGAAEIHDRAMHPPVPRVSTLGVTRSATLVSYCWTHHLADGEALGTCADGTPGHSAHPLRWRPGVDIRVDLRLPAHGVQIQAMRITGHIDGRPTHIVGLKVLRVDPSGDRWVFRLPRRAASDTDLLISGFFANGDVEADLGIRG